MARTTLRNVHEVDGEIQDRRPLPERLSGAWARLRAHVRAGGASRALAAFRVTLAPIVALALLAVMMAAPSGQAADIDRTAVDFKTPSEITWVRNAAGTNEQAVLFGDPSKPGPYVMRVRWFPGNMSRPHFHPNDRFFVVVSGTWWMGTGEKFDPESMVPAPAGSYVIHYGGRVHYDGAKGEETVIQVWGMGPATATPAEKR